MWVFQFIDDLDIIEFDVEVLVDGFQGAPDEDVVFEFDGYGCREEGAEEGEEEHCLFCGLLREVEGERGGGGGGCWESEAGEGDNGGRQ